MQAAILTALPDAMGKPVPTARVIEGLGLLSPSNAERAAVSRSLSRLEKRGLAIRLNPEICRQGSGHLWTRAAGPLSDASDISKQETNR